MRGGTKGGLGGVVILGVVLGMVKRIFIGMISISC